MNQEVMVGSGYCAHSTSEKLGLVYNSDLFAEMVSHYGVDNVPATALFLIVGLFLIQTSTYKLVTTLSAADANAKKADILNHLLADLNGVKAQQGSAKSDDDITGAPRQELDGLKARLAEYGYPTDQKTWGDLDKVIGKVKADADSTSQLGSSFQLEVQQSSSRLQNVSDFASNGVSKGWQTLQTIVSNFR